MPEDVTENFRALAAKLSEITDALTGVVDSTDDAALKVVAEQVKALTEVVRAGSRVDHYLRS
jgi:hypothetical protein